MRKLLYKTRLFGNRGTRSIIVFSIILLSFMTIGYASINTDLFVNGLANLFTSKWDIYFDNIQYEKDNVTPEKVAVITDKTRIEYEASLGNPGDKYNFTFDIVNDGTIDAKISDYSITPSLTDEQKTYLE